ncbi:9815_t:CDS:2 [Paraglomus occultum]|uniref:9815_t:CDS:1 n=1 Tax=Paraglomus occultum TaxID=144539 RepID=A0A9N8VKI1_9GLOM|nr:9815_t:CDS:2 [Paraglomus occultum]
MAHSSRNTFLVPGIPRYSRSATYRKKALHKRKRTAIKPAEKPEVEKFKTVKIGGPKNGETRIIPLEKAPKYYPAEDVSKPKISRKTAKPTKLRQSITPGSVLILLAGRFRGKRVVFLKQLTSGLLLVTGPYKFNGVPLRRVNQAFVVATSTKIDIKAVQLDGLDDQFFKREKAGSSTAEGEFFGDDKKKKKVYPETKAAKQKAVDKPIIEAVAKAPHLGDYLRSRFSLSKGRGSEEHSVGQAPCGGVDTVGDPNQLALNDTVKIRIELAGSMTIFFAPTAAGPFVNISAPYVKTTNNKDEIIQIPISCRAANITEGTVGVLQGVYKSFDGSVTQYGCADVVVVNALSADANGIRGGLTLTILAAIISVLSGL